MVSANDVELVLKANAATITDTYWFRGDGADINNEDVRFRAN